MIQHEQAEQTALFVWAKGMEWKFPDLVLLHAIPNGGARPFHINDKGQRYSRAAQQLKASGVKPGVCDFFLPSSHGHYHGFYGEMKWGKNTVSDDQKAFIKAVVANGYYASPFWHWEHARDELTRYLKLPVLRLQP
jgi:hypothetical protein